MTDDTSREHALSLLRQMVLIRRFEEEAAHQYTLQKIRGFLHLYIGEEAVAVGCVAALRPEDNLIATYREHGHALARGTPAASVMAEMFGKATGCSRGRGGSMHLFDAGRRLYGGHAIVGGGLPVAAGMALADRLTGRDAVTACFFGDGATDEGEFHEALNLASLWKLPVWFVCENNQYAMGTALARHESLTDLTVLARAHGVVTDRVDGMDVAAVERAAWAATSFVRSEGRPFFLEATTYRFRAHSMYDAELYRSKDEVVEQMAKHDPIEQHRAWLRAKAWLSPEDEEALEASVRAEVDEAVRLADEAEHEPVEHLTLDVYAPEPPR